MILKGPANTNFKTKTPSLQLGYKNICMSIKHWQNHRLTVLYGNERHYGEKEHF